jgi:EmrB/QacA subfamily drug resistance transporter
MTGASGESGAGSAMPAGHARSLCARESQPWVLAATILGSCLDFIDGTVVNVALPALQAQMGATLLDVQWVVEAYALFLAALLLTGGGLADRYGRRKIYCAGIVLFTVASICCGFAQDMRELIVARGVQGVGAALLVPGSLAIISASFPESERGRAIGIWSGFTAMAAALGPVIGGWLIENVSWRAIFFLNVPVAAVVLILVFRHVPESRDERGGALDFIGATLATLGLGSIVYGLIEAGPRGFADNTVVGALLAGVVLLVVFCVLELRIANPMLPPALFRSRQFVGANVLTLFLYAALGGSIFFFPLNLIQVQGFTATEAGASLLPFVIIMFVLSRWSGGLLDRVGSRPPLVIGPLVAAAGMALYMLPGIGGSFWTTFFPAVSVLGLGMAITVAPLTTTVMNAVAKEHSGIASGINNAVASAAGLLAVAAFGLIMVRAFNASLDAHLAQARVTAEVAHVLDAERIKGIAMEIPAGIDAGTRIELKRAIAEAFVAGFRQVMLAAALLALLSAVCAWFWFRGEPRTGTRPDS